MDTWCHSSILGEDLEILASILIGGADQIKVGTEFKGDPKIQGLS